MNENEVIVVDRIPQSIYDTLVEKAVLYSIISLPFTTDRMNIPDESRRALNIAKGKIAEYLFQYFCENNNILVDFKPCSTPFWTVDNKDFIMNNSEWDIKNNYIYHASDTLTNYNYIDLPALIPNRNSGDQWSKKDTILSKCVTNSEVLFTFIKGADLNNNQRGKDFLEIILDSKQIKYLRILYAKYQGKPQNSAPFSKKIFWSVMKKLGGQLFHKIHYYPHLIITGYANNNYWYLFKNTGRFNRENNYQNHISPRWYTKSYSGSCNFLNGTFWTTITNATVPISLLPSFLSLYPNLNKSINFGRIK